MTGGDVVVVDRAVRRRTRELDGRELVAAAGYVHRREGWWAGMVFAGPPGSRAGGLRPRDVAVVASDPRGRAVAWVADVVHARREGSGFAGDSAEAIVAGSGGLWLEEPPAGAASKAWRAVRRAHARARLGAVCGLPPVMCRRISGDAPDAIRRAVAAWLAGEEALAERLVHSAIAVRVARDEPGYRRAQAGRGARTLPREVPGGSGPE